MQIPNMITSRLSLLDRRECFLPVQQKSPCTSHVRRRTNHIPQLQSSQKEIRMSSAPCSHENLDRAEETLPQTVECAVGMKVMVTLNIDGDRHPERSMQNDHGYRPSLQRTNRTLKRTCCTFAFTPQFQMVLIRSRRFASH